MLTVTYFCTLKVWNVLTWKSVNCFTKLRNSTSSAASIPFQLTAFIKDHRLYSSGCIGLPFSYTCIEATLGQFNADHFSWRRTNQILTASTHTRESVQLRKQKLLCLPRFCDVARKGSESSPLPAIHWVTQIIPANRKCRIKTAESCTTNMQRSTWHSRSLECLYLLSLNI